MNPDGQMDNTAEPSGATPYRVPYSSHSLPAGLHVDLDQDWEVQLWTRHFGCSEAELRRAVKAVGNSADEVRAFLRRHRNN